uniref:Uncharacterized protein n=1 Tax=Oryza brachyantha TaxID=4533 RepID=J3L349_ORYBR
MEGNLAHNEIGIMIPPRKPKEGSLVINSCNCATTNRCKPLSLDKRLVNASKDLTTNSIRSVAAQPCLPFLQELTGGINYIIPHAKHGLRMHIDETGQRWGGEKGQRIDLTNGKVV